MAPITADLEMLVMAAATPAAAMGVEVAMVDIDKVHD
jgi:hypothetical protein